MSPQDPSDNGGICLLLGYQSTLHMLGCVDKHLVFMRWLGCYKKFHWTGVLGGNSES